MRGNCTSRISQSLLLATLIFPYSTGIFRAARVSLHSSTMASVAVSKVHDTLTVPPATSVASHTMVSFSAVASTFPPSPSVTGSILNSFPSGSVITSSQVVCVDSPSTNSAGSSAAACTPINPRGALSLYCSAMPVASKTPALTGSASTAMSVPMSAIFLSTSVTSIVLPCIVVYALVVCLGRMEGGSFLGHRSLGEGVRPAGRCRRPFCRAGSRAPPAVCRCRLALLSFLLFLSFLSCPPYRTTASGRPASHGLAPTIRTQ